MRFLFLAALLVAAPLAQAQASFGLKGGLNTTFKLGFTGGVFAEVPVASGFSLQPEVLYTQKGARDEVFDETLRVDYLEIPVYARLALPASPTLDAGLQLGGYVGIPLRARSVEEDFDLDANTDYGAMVGFDVGSGPYYVEGRYSLGLAQVSDDPEFIQDLPVGDLPDLKNQAVSLTFGVRFGGGGYGY